MIGNRAFAAWAMCLAILLTSLNTPAQDGMEAAKLKNSVVRINVTRQSANFREPWNPGGIGNSVGTGFVIAGKRIMTNAHVVSDARVLQIQREDDARSYEARVEFIAHDCDLAILKLEEESFFDDAEPLDFGGIPKLDTAVTAYGFPIGGSRLSITRGIVSRIEFHTYSHSGLDSHLTIQVDAAINPGNSGGPIVQNGKVVGVAFQAFSGAVAQNTGYMIPIPVVLRMLEDIKDGTYDGYVELAVDYLPLQNPSYRAKLGLPQHGPGVVVTRVLQAGSAAGVLTQGDVLLAIDGYAIASSGEIMLDGSVVKLEEIVERKFHGDTVTFDILREGKRQKAVVTLKGAWPYGIYSNRYDSTPQYILHAGILYQRLSRNFMGAYNRKDVDLVYHLENFVGEELYAETPEVVVISQVLPHSINSEVQHLVFRVVESVNDQEIRYLGDLAKAFDTPAERYVIRLEDEGRPIVIEADRLKEAEASIAERYNIPEGRGRYIGLPNDQMNISSGLQ